MPRKPKKTGPGGKRPGAGRKPKPTGTARVKHLAVRVSDAELAHLGTLREGEESTAAAVRRVALDVADQKAGDGPAEE